MLKPPTDWRAVESQIDWQALPAFDYAQFLRWLVEYSGPLTNELRSWASETIAQVSEQGGSAWKAMLVIRLTFHGMTPTEIGRLAGISCERVLKIRDQGRRLLDYKARALHAQVRRYNQRLEKEREER